MPGSIQIFASALKISERELFAQMEAGTLLAKDVLPKVGAEFAKAARLGGALSKALLTVRVQQGRFFTQLQKSQNTIFKEGFGKSFAKLLDRMTKSLVRLEPLLKGVGIAFGALFSVMKELFSFIISPLETLGQLLEIFGLLNQEGQELAGNTLSKMGAALLLLLLPLGKILAKFLLVKAAFEEIIGLTTKGIMGELERRMGKDLGFIDVSSAPSPTDSITKGSNIKEEMGVVQTLLSKGVLGLVDRTFDTNSREATLTAVGDAIAFALGSATITSSTDVSLDEFGNGMANTAVKIQAANAQAN